MGKKEYKKSVQSTVTQTLDKETGELVTLEVKNTCVAKSEPAYYKVYIQDINRIYGLNMSEQKIIQSLAANMSYNNMVVLLKPIKDIMMEQLNMPLNTLNKGIQKLAEKGLLIRQAKSVYLINPYYIAKGKWEDIESLRLQIDYSADGTRTISVTPTKKEKTQHSIE